MAWITIKGLAGKVYLPETNADAKKHACKDCFSCQNCAEERCRLCRTGLRPPMDCPIAAASEKEVGS